MLKVKILSGIPGSGKSTYQKATWPFAAVVSADGYMREILGAKGYDYDNGGEGFDPTLMPKAHQNCFRRFLALLDLNDKGQLANEHLVVDNTSLSAWEVAPYVLAAESYGLSVEIVRIHADPDEALNRQKHGVPAVAFHDRVMDDMTVIPGYVSRFNNPDFLPWWNVTDVVPTGITA